MRLLSEVHGEKKYDYPEYVLETINDMKSGLTGQKKKEVEKNFELYWDVLKKWAGKILNCVVTMCTL